MIALRRELPVIVEGRYVPFAEDDASVFAYARGGGPSGSSSGKVLPGLALRLEFPDWGVEKSTLRIERCLFVQEDAIVLAGPNRAPAITMTANRSVFVSDRLFSFESGFAGGTLVPIWTGASNVFRKGMSFWPSGTRFPGAADLAAWRKMVAENAVTELEVNIPQEITGSWSPRESLPGLDWDEDIGPFSESRDP